MTRTTTQATILAELTRVLNVEIEALQAVRDNLNEKYVQAVEMLAQCRGQVVLTGIGKSGIIATKIAATFRSTGTPAIFLHAVEALHGDLGVVRGDDIVIAIGKSGETSELNALVREVKKNGTRVICITSNVNSSMATLSDLVLDLKISQEACALNLAPTSSTTATLAVGDALAVALMKEKNISEEDFARRHPAGQLGRRLLLTIADIMRTGEDNPIIDVNASIREMIVKITAFRVGAICAIDEQGTLMGLVTDYDIRRALESGRNILQSTITDVMNPNPEVVFAADKAVHALELMRDREKPTAVLPVLDENKKVVGMIHLHDLIKAGL